jgi:NAD+ kinase
MGKGGTFRTVGLISRRGKPEVADSVASVYDCLRRCGRSVLVETHTAAVLPERPDEVVDREALGRRSELIVVVGGDGSLLGVGRDLARFRVPVVGVNRGGLGFLADIAPEQIDTVLPAVLDGEYVAEDHFLVHAAVYRADHRTGESLALNDVVVHLGALSRMMELALWVDGQFVYEQRSDGLIVATPTGSTAYSLSAGGPIMHPALDAIVIVPMFPHTLTSRPLVVRGQSEIRVVMGEHGTTDAIVSCDSQVDMPLGPGAEVRIRKSETPLRLIYPLDHSFYESCRSKLDWATRLGGSPRP